MTARIAGLVSRSEAGLTPPTSISKNITPAKGGVAIHYGGPKQSCAELDADHAKCVATWVAWQKYHVNVHGWVDIAYTGGFCNHGYAFMGRGVGIRTAAQGTNEGNQNYYGVVWLGGEGQVVTREALDAADWWVNELRKSGAGKAVKPHRFFHTTGCPGSSLVSYTVSRDDKVFVVSEPPKPTSVPVPKPTPVVTPKFPLPIGYYFGPKTGPKESVSGYYSHREDLRRWQKQMIARGWNFGSTGADGLWGPSTEKVALAFRKEKHLGIGSRITEATWQAAWTKPVT